MFQKAYYAAYYPRCSKEPGCFQCLRVFVVVERNKQDCAKVEGASLVEHSRSRDLPPHGSGVKVERTDDNRPLLSASIKPSSRLSQDNGPSGSVHADVSFFTVDIF